ncbi:MAG: glycosyltransferase [Thomasclavelia sp.]
MEANDLVSIVVPVNKSNSSLEIAVSSALNQTFNNIQVIIVDGSLDNKVKKLVNEKFSANSKIIYLKADSNNIAFLRNEGIKASDGMYLTFLNPDDLLTPDFIAEFFTHLVHNFDRCDFVIGKITERIDIRSNNKEKYYEYDQFKFKCFESLKFKELNNVYAKLFFTKYIKEYNIFFDEKSNIGRDLLFNCNYLYHCKDIKIFNKPIYLINQEARIENYIYDGDLFDNEKIFIKKLEQFLLNNNISANIANYLYIKLGYEELVQDIAYMKKKWVRLSDKICYITNKQEIIDAMANYKFSSFLPDLLFASMKFKNQYLIRVGIYILYFYKYKKNSFNRKNFIYQKM